MKSSGGVGTADCQRLSFLRNSSLVPRVWVNPESFLSILREKIDLTLGEWVGFVPARVLSLVWHYYILEASELGTNLIQNGSNRIFGLGREIEGLVNLIQNQSI